MRLFKELVKEFKPWYDPNYKATDKYCNSEFRTVLGKSQSGYYQTISEGNVVQGRQSLLKLIVGMDPFID